MSLTVEKCLQAWTNSLRQMNAKADIVFFGDSLTYYGDFSSVFPDKIVCNLGLRGDTIQGMINRVNQLKLLNPKKVYLMAGINDITLISGFGFRKQYEELVLVIKDSIPNVDLVIQNMLPVNDRDYVISCKKEQIIDCNREIYEIAQEHALQLLDLFSIYQQDDILPKNITTDGLHIRPEAYYKWMRYLVLSNPQDSFSSKEEVENNKIEK